ncbi:hypothetical protein EWM64_g4976 [Hericium alpestre]|uniref:C2H2-type domain-containing protein n=1 Tax=Hericium alpestre TaxID=135208 RepID=A0A4Y9ZVX5_9AGAM|nr:hypothetical protein EWM64_g4976 [Hericium alpestre]
MSAGNGYFKNLQGTITHHTAETPTADDGEEWNEEDEDYDEEEEVDANAEAEEIARRLNDQLWAEISKAQAEAAATAAVPVSQVSPHPPPSGPATAPAPTAGRHGAGTPLHSGAGPSKTRHTKLGEALTTMKAILEYTDKDPLAQSTLRTTLVPNSDGSNVLDILNSTVASGSLSKDLAGRLSHLLVSLARSDTLFSSLRHSNASSIQLEQGKRKREETEVEISDPRAVKRPMYQPPPSYDLHHQINEASRIITNALIPLAHPSNKDQPLDPGVIASIQLQLHQVFLFAVTSAAQGGHATHTLQEIGGLIQVLGVLSGIQIGGPSAHPPPPPGFPHDPSAPWIPPGHPSPFTHDIGTAVYSCPFPNCPKTFSRLFNMRTHHRAHTTVRPFHCLHCPASFARNHDLKRHVRLHGGRAWKCAGCDKVFSRRARTARLWLWMRRSSRRSARAASG